MATSRSSTCSRPPSGEAARAPSGHYRSRDERLIAFSNDWIYEHSLTTFPGVTGSECLAHVLVEQQLGLPGQEDGVTAEVQRVVDLICRHAETRPWESLGVITMGFKRAERIDLALRHVLLGRPELHAFLEEAQPQKRFFIKNLERVQGDERDAIILSIVYGKASNGWPPYRFGPLLRARSLHPAVRSPRQTLKRAIRRRPIESVDLGHRCIRACDQRKQRPAGRRRDRLAGIRHATAHRGAAAY